MADAKIITYGQQISAGTTAIPDNTALALDISSTDAKDYVQINTTDSGESLLLTGGGSGLRISDNGQVKGSASNTFALLNEDGTATNPNICPRADDVDTGIGWAAADQLSLIAGGVEGVRVTESGDAITNVTCNGPVGIRESAITNHWTGARDLVVKGADSAGITLRAASSTYNTSLAFADADGTAAQGCGGVIQYIHNGDYARLYAKYNGDGASANASGEHVIRYNEYGMGKMRNSTAYDSTARDSATNTSRPVYLATTSSTNDTLVIDYEHGTVGEITLTNNITAIKFFNVPRHGSAQTMTVKIKQASSAVTLSYSSVTIYWNTAATKAGNLLWSGGVSHTLSTGNNEIDIVQFTCLPHGDTNRDIYASVIGQNFS